MTNTSFAKSHPVSVTNKRQQVFKLNQSSQSIDFKKQQLIKKDKGAIYQKATSAKSCLSSQSENGFNNNSQHFVSSYTKSS